MRFVLGLVLAALLAAPASAQRFEASTGFGHKATEILEVVGFAGRKFDKCGSAYDGGNRCAIGLKEGEFGFRSNPGGYVRSVEAFIPIAHLDAGQRRFQSILAAINSDRFDVAGIIDDVRSGRPVPRRIAGLDLDINSTDRVIIVIVSVPTHR